MKPGDKTLLNYVIWYVLTIILLSGAGSYTLTRDIHHEIIIRPHYSVLLPWSPVNDISSMNILKFSVGLPPAPKDGQHQPSDKTNSSY